MGGIPKKKLKNQKPWDFSKHMIQLIVLLLKNQTQIVLLLFILAKNKKNCLFKGEKVVVNRSFNVYEGPRIGGKERIDEFGRTKKY